MKQSKQITDGALMLALFVIFILLILFVPMLSPIIMFLLPIPFIVYTAEYDWIAALILAVGAMIILTVILLNFTSIPIVVFASAGGIVIGASMYGGKNPYKTWANGAVGFIIGILFAYLFTQYLFEVNWVNEIDAMIAESLQMSKDMVEQFGFTQIDEQFELVEEQFAHITDQLPAGIVIVSIVFAFLSQWVSYKYLNVFKDKEYKFPPFRQLKLPVALVWIYFFALLVTLLGLKPDEIVYIFASNIIVLVGFLLSIQGFSFIFFYAHYKRWSKAIPI